MSLDNKTPVQDIQQASYENDAQAVRVVLYGKSGEDYLPIVVNSDGTLGIPQPNVEGGYAPLDENGDLTGRIRLRRNTSANIDNLTLEEGEWAYATDTKQWRFGDGSTVGGYPLNWLAPSMNLQDADEEKVFEFGTNASEENPQGSLRFLYTSANNNFYNRDMLTLSDAMDEKTVGLSLTGPIRGLSIYGNNVEQVLFFKSAANFALADTDQAITAAGLASFNNFRLTRAFVVHRSGAYNTACLGGIYTAANKGGTALVDASQSYAGLTGSGKIQDITLAAVNSTDVQFVPGNTLYLNLSTANGAALTGDIYLIGYPLPGGF